MDKELFKKCITFSLSLLITIGCGISIFFIFYHFEEVKGLIDNILLILRPILYGIVIAYLLRPVCNFFELKYQKGLNKINKKNKLKEDKINKLALSLAIATSFLSIFSLIFFLLKLIIPQLIESIPLLADALIEVLNNCTNFIRSKPDNFFFQFIISYIDSNNITLDKTTLIEKYLTPNSSAIFAGLYDGVSNTVLIIKDLFIGIVVSVYLLVYKRRLGHQVKLIMYSILPKKIAEAIHEETVFGDKIFNGFLVGKIIDSLIIGLLAYVGLAILKMPFAALISIIIGVTNIIPFFGPFIGAIPSAIIICAVSPIKALIFLIFILVLQQFDGNILGPKILGSATGVSSFWVLFSILIFGGLFGIVGMIIGIPIFAILHDLIKKLVYKLLNKKNEQQMIKEYNNIYHKE